jgi:DNA-binding MarR family transcriptional regulator
MTKIKSFEDKITSLIFLIGRNMRQQNAESCEHSSKERLTFSQLEALKFIKEHKNPLMKEVSNHLSIAAPSLTPLIDELEKRSLIARGSLENDRRAVLLVLTKKGEEMLEKISKIRAQKMQYIFSRLTINEQESLVGILEKLAL